VPARRIRLVIWADRPVSSLSVDRRFGCALRLEGGILYFGEDRMFTCSKTYRDIPFAHRQHRHDGHCSFLHGHNWGIEIEFGCERLDERGFVVDFGGLGFLKTWIADHLDHACLFAKEDPVREKLLKDYPKLFRPLVIDSVSTEGIAKFLFETFDPMVRKETGGRAWVRQIILHEDTKNKASYQPKA